MNPFPFVPNQLLLGDLSSPVAVCCGWTPRESVKQMLDAGILGRIACVGQLYTAERGVDMMVRNLLAVPSITDVIFTGNDRTKACDQMRRMWVGDLAVNADGNWAFENIVVGKDIPAEAIDGLRSGVRLWGPVHYDGVKELVGRIMGRVSPPEPPRQPQVFVQVKEEPPDFPAPDSAHVVRGKTIDDVYLKVLYNIMTFGRRIHTHYDQDSKEIMDLVAVVTDQNPNPKAGDLSPFIPFSFEHFSAYKGKLLSPEKDGQVTYTYGNRMRAHFGADQIKEVVDKIVKEPVTRSAVISLWDAGKEGGGSPCLNHLWFRVRDGALHMTATIRSNDMFMGWPENAYGLRYLQEQVRLMILSGQGSFNDDGSLVLGDLVINSQSAHVYEDCWASATDAIEAYYAPVQWWDEKGQWTFERDEAGVVKAAELHAGSLFVTRIEGTPTHIRLEIAKRNLVSDVGHALYVGAMLEKTEAGKKT